MPAEPVRAHLLLLVQCINLCLHKRDTGHLSPLSFLLLNLSREEDAFNTYHLITPHYTLVNEQSRNKGLDCQQLSIWMGVAVTYSEDNTT